MLQSSCSHLCAHLPGEKPLKPKRIFGPKGAWEAKATNVHTLGSLPPVATRRHEELLQAGVDVPVTATLCTIKHRVDSNRTAKAANIRRELEKQQQKWHATIQCHDSKTGRNINSNDISSLAQTISLILVPTFFNQHVGRSSMMLWLGGGGDAPRPEKVNPGTRGPWSPPFLRGLADTRWLKFRFFATTSVWNVYTSHIYIIMCIPLSWMLKFNFILVKCYSKSYFLKT